MHTPKLRREQGTGVAGLAAASTEGTGTEDATTSSRSELRTERRKVQYLHLLIELFRQVVNIVLVGLKISIFKFCIQPSESTKSISSIVAMTITMITPVSSLTQLERHRGLGDNDNSLTHLSKCKDLSVVEPHRRYRLACVHWQCVAEHERNSRDRSWKRECLRNLEKNTPLAPNTPRTCWTSLGSSIANVSPRDQEEMRLTL